jgi:hypothetical protein
VAPAAATALVPAVPTGVARVERCGALVWVTLSREELDVRFGFTKLSGVIVPVDGVPVLVGVTVGTGVRVLLEAALITVGVGVGVLVASGDVVKLKFPDVVGEAAVGSAAGSAPVVCDEPGQRPWHTAPELEDPPICADGVAVAVAPVVGSVGVVVVSVGVVAVPVGVVVVSVGVVVVPVGVVVVSVGVVVVPVGVVVVPVGVVVVVVSVGAGVVVAGAGVVVVGVVAVVVVVAAGVGSVGAGVVGVGAAGVVAAAGVVGAGGIAAGADWLAAGDVVRCAIDLGLIARRVCSGVRCASARPASCCSRTWRVYVPSPAAAPPTPKIAQPMAMTSPIVQAPLLR